MTETLLTPPASETYGYVTATVMRSRGDTVADGNDTPDYLPQSGTVTFTSARSWDALTDALVVRDTVTSIIDPATGQLTMADVAGPVKLWVGEWTASFALDSEPGEPVRVIPPITFTLTVDHTFGSPLKLSAAAPVTPPATTILQALAVPALVEGNVLTVVNGQLAWTAGWGTGLDNNVAGYINSDSATRSAGDRRWQRGVNVAAYGVVADGVTPTGAALTDAISAASTLGVPLLLPKGRYAFDQVNIPSGMSIIGSGPETVIVQSNAAKPCFQAIGSESLLGSLTADLAQGASTITITQSWGLVAGDLIIVSDNFSYSATDASYKSGEMLEVASSTGTAITLRNPVRGSFASGGAYTTANAAVLYKVTPKRGIRLESMTLEGHATSDNMIVQFSYCEDVLVRDVNVASSPNSIFKVDCCKDVSILGGVIDNVTFNLGAGRGGYGVAIIGSCYGITVDGLVCNLARHAVTTLGSARGIPRKLTFANIRTETISDVAGVDTHAAAEGVLITGCHIYGSGIGVTVRGRNVTVEGCEIRGVAPGAGIWVTEKVAQGVTITGNRVLGCRYGIRVGETTGLGVEGVTILGNHVTGSTDQGVRVEADVVGVYIADNLVTRSGLHGILVSQAATDILIHGNRVVDAALTGTCGGIEVSGGTLRTGRCDITSNATRQTGTPAVRMNRSVYTTRSNTDAAVVGNICFGSYISAGSEFYTSTGSQNSLNTLVA